MQVFLFRLVKPSRPGEDTGAPGSHIHISREASNLCFDSAHGGIPVLLVRVPANLDLPTGGCCLSRRTRCGQRDANQHTTAQNTDVAHTFTSVGEDRVTRGLLSVCPLSGEK